MSSVVKSALANMDPEQLAKEVAIRQVKAVRKALYDEGFSSETIGEVCRRTRRETEAEAHVCLGNKIPNGALMVVATAFYPPLSVPNLGTTIEEAPE